MMDLFCSRKIVPVTRLKVPRGKQKLIKTVIKCPNNMVMVLDGEGEQVPEYQGQYQEVRESILRGAPLNAVFGYLSDSEPELREVPREEW